MTTFLEMTRNRTADALYDKYEERLCEIKRGITYAAKIGQRFVYAYPASEEEIHAVHTYFSVLGFRVDHKTCNVADSTSNLLISW